MLFRKKILIYLCLLKSQYKKIRKKINSVFLANEENILNIKINKFNFLSPISYLFLIGKKLELNNY